MPSTKCSVDGAGLTRNSGTMSERESEQDPVEGGAVPAEPGSPPAVEPARPPGGTSRVSGRAARWLAGLLILVVAAVGLSPFVGTKIQPLFPAGENRDDDASTS